VRSVLFAAVAAIFAAGSSAALANPAGLTSNATASVFGGCNCGGAVLDQTSSTLPSLTSNVTNQDPSGSFGNAFVTTTYGTQKVYADAFQAPGDPGPDVQSQAFSEYDEHFGPNVFVSSYTMTFPVSGSMSAEPPVGPGSDAYLHWNFTDITLGGASISFGTWVVESGAPPPVISFSVPSGDSYELDVQFVASAFSQNPFTSGKIFADYSHTAHTYIDAVGGGPDVIGQSGHDYATPAAVGGAPEPAAWALMLLGFGSLGLALRRRAAIA